MKVDEVLASAYFAIGHKTVYRLGAKPPRTAPLPQDESGASDCSGFAVTWLLRLRAHHPELAWLVRLNGGWMNTDGVFADTLNPTGFFEKCSPRPGALIVFPARWSAQSVAPAGKKNPSIGHVGIVSRVDPIRIIHCSAGNYRRTGDAIRETTDAVFKVPVVDFAWFSGLED